VSEIALIDGERAVWSPVANELVLDNCSAISFLNQIPDQYIYLASEPDFIPKTINPPDIFCSAYTRFEWRPDGQQILFNALPATSPLIDSSLLDTTFLFMMDRDGANLSKTNAGGWLFDFYGWMDNDRLVKRSYRGGGNWIVSIYDIETDEELAWAWIFAHKVRAVNSQYVAAESGEPCCNMSAAVFSTVPLRPEPEPTLEIGSRSGAGPYINHLSITEESWQHLFNSNFQDWIDESNQMLVLTWDADVRLPSDILYNAPVTDLQIWDVKSDELTLLVPGAVFGRISLNRRYLTYLLPSSDSPLLHLFDRNSGEIIFSQPAYAEADEYAGVVTSFTSFSPDSRFLTFFTPESNLVILDLENNDIAAELPADTMTPIWSPNSNQFVYRGTGNGLSIYNAQSGSHFPLASSGSERLSTPQWSHDGAFLSVGVLQEDSKFDTAVLTIP